MRVVSVLFATQPGALAALKGVGASRASRRAVLPGTMTVPSLGAVQFWYSWSPNVGKADVSTMGRTPVEIMLRWAVSSADMPSAEELYISILVNWGVQDVAPPILLNTDGGRALLTNMSTPYNRAWPSGAPSTNMSMAAPGKTNGKERVRFFCCGMAVADGISLQNICLPWQADATGAAERHGVRLGVCVAVVVLVAVAVVVGDALLELEALLEARVLPLAAADGDSEGEAVVEPDAVFVAVAEPVAVSVPLVVPEAVAVRVSVCVPEADPVDVGTPVVVPNGVAVLALEPEAAGEAEAAGERDAAGLADARADGDGGGVGRALSDTRGEGEGGAVGAALPDASAEGDAKVEPVGAAGVGVPDALELLLAQGVGDVGAVPTAEPDAACEAKGRGDGDADAVVEALPHGDPVRVLLLVGVPLLVAVDAGEVVAEGVVDKDTLLVAEPVAVAVDDNETVAEGVLDNDTLDVAVLVCKALAVSEPVAEGVPVLVAVSVDPPVGSDEKVATEVLVAVCVPVAVEERHIEGVGEKVRLAVPDAQRLPVGEAERLGVSHAERVGYCDAEAHAEALPRAFDADWDADGLTAGLPDDEGNMEFVR